jgi:hypothetical protein
MRTNMPSSQTYKSYIIFTYMFYVVMKQYACKSSYLVSLVSLFMNSLKIRRFPLHIISFTLNLMELIWMYRGFEPWWGERIFSVYLILPAALDPGLFSASNRNEDGKQKNNERCRCVRLTTLAPTRSQLSRQCGILNISQLYRARGRLQES